MNIVTIPNIADLKNFPIPAHQTTVYVQGYYQPDDGGESMFIYDQDCVEPENYGIIFKPATLPSGPTPGRWIRQYEAHLNVGYFGVMKLPNNPLPPYNAARIQDAIDYAHNVLTASSINPKIHGDLTIYIPAGTYWIDRTIIIRDKTHIKGDNGTELWMMINKDEPTDYMFETDKGPLSRITIERLYLDLGAYRELKEYMTTGGILIDAQLPVPATEGSTGGLGGTAVIKDIMMRNVGGHGIRLRGGDVITDGVKKCNQYIFFDNIWVERLKEDKNCVKMTGEQVNLSFMSCEFTMPFYSKPFGRDAGTNVWIDSVDQEAPRINAEIIFTNCSSGGSPGYPVQHAFWMRNAENIMLENCWIEDTEIGIYISNSDAVSILNTRFANAARAYETDKFGSLGRCIQIGSKSFVTIERNLVTAFPVENQLFIMGTDDDNVINASNNNFNNIRLSQTFGITQYADVVPINLDYYDPIVAPVPGIEIGGKKLVLIESDKSQVDLWRIDSTISAGEYLFIRAENTEVLIHAWNPTNELQGRNIYLGNETSILLKKGQGATFIKSDGVNNQERCCYQIISKF